MNYMRLWKFESQSMKHKFYMVHHRDKYLSKSLIDFMDTVDKSLA